MTQDLTIGEAAKAAGLSVDAVRFYERVGALAPPPRTAGGRRLYGPVEVRELSTIARFRALRMPLPQIARYLALARQGEATVSERSRIVAQQRQKVLEQIASLQETLRVLDHKLAHWAEIQTKDAAASQRLRVIK